MVSGPVKDVSSHERPADTDHQEETDVGSVQGDPLIEPGCFIRCKQCRVLQ